MMKEYTKPLMIDLNEQTGLGACSSGSGAVELCNNGNQALGVGACAVGYAVINCGTGSGGSG
jgi:hypothetical protein